MHPILLVAGTRPEGIKVAPVYLALKQAKIPVLFCATSQHDQLLQEVLSIFKIKPDIDLKIMQKGQDLFYVTSELINRMKKVFEEINPSIVLVQGDTTTAMASGLAAFYKQIPLGHIEAGLRTGDLQAPYPEEFNRCLLGKISTYHFAPTQQAAANLIREGNLDKNVFCVGNTIVDALRIVKEGINNNHFFINPLVKDFFNQAQFKNTKTILFTMHRRESFGNPMESMLLELKKFALNHSGVKILYPYHPNPKVLEVIQKVDLKSCENITLIPPITYPDLVYALLNVDIVITDSGGIQEEAVSLRKRVIVLREKSERMEGVWDGYAILVGFDAQKVVTSLKKELEIKPSLKDSYVSFNTIYGDGFTSEKIVKILKDFVLKENFINIPIAYIKEYEKV